MVEFKTIKEYCNKININDVSIINYIYNNQPGMKYDKNKYHNYAKTKINRICDLTPKKFVNKIINNINENKIENFTKNNNYYYIWNENHKNLLIQHCNTYNDLMLYIMSLLSQNKKLKTKDILYLCSDKFNVSEKTIYRHIKNFMDTTKFSNFTVESFLLYLKHKVLK